MAKHELHDRAIQMRKSGMSYSQIKTELKVSKSTLSLWLHAYPLSKERISELRDHNERRIERCRQTKLKKKQERHERTYQAMHSQIRTLSSRDLFISGLFLYWAEGTKASPGTVQLTNTDPAMLIFFIKWFESQGVERSRLRAYLHLYADMDVQKATRFWAKALGISEKVFRKPYIKPSCKDKRRNYKGRFGYGTCNLVLHSQDMYERVMLGVRYIRTQYGGDGFPILQAL